ncbi:MAG: sigma-70 family RNA polymerase sigma factor [Micropruina sp.]|uniref:sigma-70 family RNA polymerase sigma factor n=1 Tax=Micropruina sp. TaxID=2737536 RepID=UPI0039E3CCAF
MSNATELLGADDEIRLARAIEAGLLAGERLERGDDSVGTITELMELERRGRDAWQRFLLANLRLVQSVAAHEARRSPAGLDELFQEGFLGLAEALQRWDWASGYRFSTYALQWIRRRVWDAAVDQRVPVSVRTALRARGVRGLADELTGELQRTATDADLARLLGRTERWVARMRHLPLWAPLDPDLAAETPHEPEEHPDVRTLLRALPFVEAEVVRTRFGLDGDPALRQATAAQTLGMSISTLRRHEARALRRMRRWLLADQAA